MSRIAQNIITLRQMIPPHVKIVAVSKTKPVSDILEAYNAGQRIFGENRVQELISKKDSLPPDIEWHLVGHLQTNKVRYLVPFISMIHSVDSLKLLKVIDTEAKRINRIVDCLLQFHIALEESKFGFSPGEVDDMINTQEFRQLDSVRICGVMGMATFTEDMEKVREEFRNLVLYFRMLREKYFSREKSFSEISMGMSGDFMTAIEEGSTMVRIGSVIFGERNK